MTDKIPGVSLDPYSLTQRQEVPSKKEVLLQINDKVAECYKCRMQKEENSMHLTGNRFICEPCSKRWSWTFDEFDADFFIPKAMMIGGAAIIVYLLPQLIIDK